MPEPDRPTSDGSAARAQQVIDDARLAFGDADAFDHLVGVEFAAYHQLADQLHEASDQLANQHHPIMPGDGPEKLAENRERRRAHWQMVKRHLETYAAECRDATYTGWSRESGGPIRRTI